MLPQPLIVEFWWEVQDKLEKDYGVPKEKAHLGITEYMAIAEKHNFENLIYHKNPQDVAATIAGRLSLDGLQQSCNP